MLSPGHFLILFVIALFHLGQRARRLGEVQESKSRLCSASTFVSRFSIRGWLWVAMELIRIHPVRRIGCVVTQST